MIKHLLRILDDSGVTVSEHGDYTIVTSCFRKFDKIKNEYFKIDSVSGEDEYTLAESEKIDSPIYAIEKDDSEPVLYLFKGDLSEKKKATVSQLTYYDFYNEIKTLSGNYKNIEVVSLSRINIDERNKDTGVIPIVDIFLDEKNNKICFIESAAY